MKNHRQGASTNPVPILFRDCNARMLEEFSRTLRGLISGAAVGAEPADPDKLPIAAILVHVAHADGKLPEAEKARLNRLLAERFGLDQRATRRLVAVAEIHDAETGDLADLVTGLRRVLPRPERARFLASLWELALSDGELHEFEEGLILRCADWLGFSESEARACRHGEDIAMRENG